MRAALSEAKKAIGQTSPNPAVGAVLVVGNRIVSRGHHRGAGRDHAEVECLHNFGAHVACSGDTFTLLWNRAPQKDALLRARMRYFKRESETSLSARLT